MPKTKPEPPKDDQDTSFFESATADTINQPDLDPETLQPGRTALTNAAQAWSVFSKLRQDQRDRNDVNSQITEIFNGRAPFAESDIEGWQMNFSTLFMRGVIDKTVPVLTDYIEKAKWLTQSRLKEDSVEAETKSNKLRDLVTKAIRSWDGWRSFCSALCQELMLVGYTFAIRTDEDTPWPAHYRSDKAFVPDGTPQFAKHIQFIGIEQDFYINELTDIIQEREQAEANGWIEDAVIEAINRSMPTRDDADENTNPRRWADIVQEGNAGAAMSSGARTVKAAHLFAVETGQNGKVTHVILDRENKHEALLWKEARFDDIQDQVTLFTLDPGNGNFYSSMGLGTRLSNYSVGIDAATMNSLDQKRIAGLIPMQMDQGKTCPPPKVKAPFLYISKEATIVPRSPVPADSQDYILLIQQLIKMAEVATQQYVPSATAVGSDESGGRKTARETTVDYTREQQSVAAFVGRFAGQFAGLIESIQKALAREDSGHEAAKEFQLRALGNKKLKIDPICTPEELAEFVASPAAEVLQDLTMQESAAKLALANDPEIMQSPFIDQKRRLEMKLTAFPVPTTISSALLKPEALDPNDEAEQFAQQTGETNDIMQGASVPVSGRQNHKVHLDALVPDMLKGFDGLQQAASANPEAATGPEMGQALDHLNAGIVHGDAHVAKWEASGAPPAAIQPHKAALGMLTDKLHKFGADLMKLRQTQDQARAKQAADLQKAVPAGAGQLPGQVSQGQGQPPEPTSPADLVKMYVAPGTPQDIKRQIERDLGLQPSTEAGGNPALDPALQAPPSRILPTAPTIPPQPKGAPGTAVPQLEPAGSNGEAASPA